MGTHETPDAVLTRLEADRLRARALELVAELDGIQVLLSHPETLREADEERWRWAGAASVILAELARG